MNGNKPAWASMTVWSSVLSAIFVVLGLLGYEIAPDLQGEIGESVNYILAAVLSVLAVIGRFRAKKSIGKPPATLPALAAAMILPLAIVAAAVPLAACSSSTGGPVQTHPRNCGSGSGTGIPCHDGNRGPREH